MEEAKRACGVLSGVGPDAFRTLEDACLSKVTTGKGGGGKDGGGRLLRELSVVKRKPPTLCVLKELCFVTVEFGSGQFGSQVNSTSFLISFIIAIPAETSNNTHSVRSGYVTVTEAAPAPRKPIVAKLNPGITGRSKQS